MLAERGNSMLLGARAPAGSSAPRGGGPGRGGWPALEVVGHTAAVSEGVASSRAQAARACLGVAVWAGPYAEEER